MAEEQDQSGGPTAGASSDRAVQDALADTQQALSDLEQQFDTQNPGFSPQLQEKLDMLGDVELDVTIELGRAQLLVEEVLKLQDGSVVELDKLAGDPVEVFVNGKRVARGEVLILNEDFCIRISEIDSTCEQRISEVLADSAKAA